MANLYECDSCIKLITGNRFVVRVEYAGHVTCPAFAKALDAPKSTSFDLCETCRTDLTSLVAERRAARKAEIAST